MDYQETSYEKHSQSYQTLKKDEEEIALYEDWFSKGTTDVWRHLRMLENLKPFFHNYPDSSWLTIGDGRFGTSARYIEKNSSKALATDIDISLLKIAFEKNWISGYACENAEKLSFENNSFDFVLCKEAFHHFPRPMVALYEMIRVANKAVILIEPADWIPVPFTRFILQYFKILLKKIFGKQILHPDTGNYEEHNYIYTISEREFQKVALALYLPVVAFKRFHDFYYTGVELEKISDKAPLYKKIKKKLFCYTFQKKIGIHNYNHIVSIIFKEKMKDDLLKQLTDLKFKVITLPQNPHQTK